MKLDEHFFQKDSVKLAQDLLGCLLVHETAEGRTSGIIVETEAYSQEDAASHSFNGITNRTQVMFGPAGYAYIYFTCGMHYCFKVVSGEEGNGQAVLIRALEPVEDIELMAQRRGKDDIKQLCSGPAKLVQAMNITKADYGKSLFDSNLFLEPHLQNEIEIAVGPRIGIKQAADVP